MTRGITRTRLRGAWHRYRAPYLFVSFPKSGRTWTRQLLESYLVRLYNLPDLDFESEALWYRKGRRRSIPRIVFVHPPSTDPDPAGTQAFVDSIRQKKIVLLFRDPRKVVYTYYFRLLKRFNEPRVQAMGIGEFIRHPEFGIERIVGFTNTWYSSRNSFRDHLVLRFEDLVVQPAMEMARLLSFLEIRVDPDLLDRVIAETPDRTTVALEDPSVVLAPADQEYLLRATEALDPGLGYQIGGRLVETEE